MTQVAADSTAELLCRSYQQWCQENRPYDRKKREAVGRFMAQLYQHGRPAGSHPIYELDSIDAAAVNQRVARGREYASERR
jgi:hypothetical protein